jgi:hypothetical protein
MQPSLENFWRAERMFIIIGIVVVFGAVVGGFLMEHGPEGADAARGGGDHRRSRDWDAVDRQSDARAEEHHRGSYRSVRRVEIQQSGVSGNSENDVRAAQPGAKRRA